MGTRMFHHSTNICWGACAVPSTVRGTGGTVTKRVLGEPGPHGASTLALGHSEGACACRWGRADRQRNRTGRDIPFHTARGWIVSPKILTPSTLCDLIWKSVLYRCDPVKMKSLARPKSNDGRLCQKRRHRHMQRTRSWEGVGELGGMRPQAKGSPGSPR